MKHAKWIFTALVVTTAVAAPPSEVPPAGSPPVSKDRQEQLPGTLEGVEVVEHLGESLPLDLYFKDDEGHTVKLGDYFNKDKPVILTLNYFRCPMLCTLQLNGMVDALKDLGWLPGKEFEVVTVSFDPRETPRLAKAKKESYIGMYGDIRAAQGWHFLTGKQDAITALTSATGFGYRWNAERQEYAHKAVLMICTPEGKLSRYIGNVKFDPATLRLALVEAADGRIGSPLDQFLLYCFHYDATSGRYGPAAMKIMRLAAAFTVVGVGALLVGLRFRSSRRRARAQRAKPADPDAGPSS
jgi:protein SCO1/2